jgi:hypothetical protein
VNSLDNVGAFLLAAHSDGEASDAAEGGEPSGGDATSRPPRAILFVAKRGDSIDQMPHHRRQ